MTQMEKWSLLSHILNYVQHNKFNSMNHTLNIRPVKDIRSNQTWEKNLES